MNSAVKSATKSTPVTAPAAEPENEMHEVVSLLSERATALSRLGEIQIDADRFLQMHARSVQKEHTDLTELVVTIDGEIEEIVRRHPEWFLKRKSIPTAFGTPKLTSSTSLEVNDEARAIDLVVQNHKRRVTELLRLTWTLNREALEELSDEQLLALGIRRVVTDKFSIAASKVPLAEAVKNASTTKEGAR